MHWMGPVDLRDWQEADVLLLGRVRHVALDVLSGECSHGLVGPIHPGQGVCSRSPSGPRVDLCEEGRLELRLHLGPGCILIVRGHSARYVHEMRDEVVGAAALVVWVHEPKRRESASDRGIVKSQLSDRGMENQ